MGILHKIFGKKREYPPLEPDSPAAEQLRRAEPALKSLMDAVPDDLEIIPANDETYVFLGRPPNTFGLAWIRDGQVTNLKDVIDEYDIAPHRAQAFIEQLRAAYEGSDVEDRFKTELAGKSVVVTPSDNLRRRVHDIVEKLAA